MTGGGVFFPMTNKIPGSQSFFFFFLGNVGSVTRRRVLESQPRSEAGILSMKQPKQNLRIKKTPGVAQKRAWKHIVTRLALKLPRQSLSLVASCSYSKDGIEIPHQPAVILPRVPLHCPVYRECRGDTWRMARCRMGHTGQRKTFWGVSGEEVFRMFVTTCT